MTKTLKSKNVQNVRNLNAALMEQTGNYYRIGWISRRAMRQARRAQRAI